MPRTKPDLIIPVYLNQRVVFDLLAMLQDGITHLTKVTEVDGEKKTDSREVAATFGLGQALAGLLKVDLSARGAKSRDNTSENTREEERVHTPASLFFKLREMLSEAGSVASIGTDHDPRPGEIVEFGTNLRRNPLIEALDMMGGMVRLGSMFEDPPKSGGKKPSVTPNQVLSEQITKLREMLVGGSTVDIISDRLPSGFTAILTLEEAFLNDPTMADLVDGNFRVIGKVTRVIPDSNEAFSLIRKTAMSAFSKAKLQEAFSGFDTMTETEGYHIPKMVWEIPGPVFQVLPLGIFT
jgi:hypothetical protein